MASKIKSETHLKPELIQKYRESIALRYEPSQLMSIFELPEGVEEKEILALKEYFLDYIYPPPAERERLEASFETLKHFLSQPTKVWFLLGNMATAIFKYGRMFPQALKAGYSALEAYLKATEFEEKLLRAAVEKKIKSPLLQPQFEDCLRALPKESMQQFANEVCHLFEILANVDLLKRTIVIMENIVDKMEQNTDRFTRKETEAIEWGVEILRKGYALFSVMPADLRSSIIDVVRENEREFIETLFAHSKS